MKGGIYIHIPFCRNKCLYCDFYSAGARIADWESYLRCLLRELSIKRDEIPSDFDTLYIGGGTPSLIPGHLFEDFIQKLNMITGSKAWKEFTIEVNPEDINDSNLVSWKKSGVNRVSMGVQSLNDSELKKIGRNHTSRQAIEAIKKLKENFSNISLDIIYGLPGQTVNSYEDSLNRLLTFMPQHISVYSLMLEEGTALSLLVNKNKLLLPSEDEWQAMYEITLERLRKSGYHRYEISNFSLPGKESLHNRSYWEGLPYLGIGPGAHSYDGKKTRSWNPADLKGYIRYYSNPESNEGNLFISGGENIAFLRNEILSDEEVREEYLMTRLRTSSGIELANFTLRFGILAKENLLKKSSVYIERGFLEECNDRLFFTDKGFLLSDDIISRLI